MIRLGEVSVSFQGRPLFSGLNWQITDQSRFGLVGVNGSGKSTLLKVLVGQQEIDQGSISRAKNFTIGYLPQELQSASQQTVFEEALAGCGTARELQIKLETMQKALHDADPLSEDYTELVYEFGRLQHLFEELDGFSVESKTARVLQGLAIPKEWWSWPVRQFSGGWQMRVQLARLILSSPSLLLLDEPTNHLDVESIIWLSSFMRTYEGGLVVISHDRYFLDENIKEIVEIWNGNLHFYSGNYSFYVSEKQKRLELLRNAYQNQQEEIERTERFIERFRYKATKARQVQSRVKMLEKIERIEIPEDTAHIRLLLPPAPRSGRVVLECKGLGHSYENNPVFSNLNFSIERGEKIVLVGVNGAGKTTLLKILAGNMKPSSGEVRIGHNVFSAYYAQIVADQLNLDNTVLEEMLRADTNHNETQLRTVLGSFLFRGEDVYKKVSVLSGGEKSRLALAKILLQPCNLLLLDEPTNHLDMASKEILLDALRNYDGTVLIISHDRYFMDQLSEKTLELKGGTLASYPYNYSGYLAKVSQSEAPAAETAKQAPSPSSHKDKDQKRAEAEARAKNSKFRKEVLLPLEELERSIGEKEGKLLDLEKTLALDEIYQQKGMFEDYLKQYQDLKLALERDLKKWEELQIKKEQQ